MRPPRGEASGADKVTLERIYRENAGRVYALCLRMVGDPARAEELTQDVFVRAWKKLDQFRGDAAVSSWLHRIAVNVVLQAQRSERRRRARVLTAADMPTHNDGTLDGNARARPVATGIDLERAIRALPEGARAIFVLHDIEGYKHTEIAELTGLAVGTTKAQLHRARKLLREALS